MSTLSQTPPCLFEENYIPASLIRQHCFCSRIPFFQYVRGIRPVSQPWMTQGEEFHDKSSRLQKRRVSLFKSPVFNAFDPNKFSIENNVRLLSEKLQIQGVCDAVISYEGKPISAVDYKLTKEIKPRRGHILQLTLYAMMLEEMNPGEVIKTGFLILGQKAKIVPINFSQKIRLDCMKSLEQMKKNLSNANLPNSSAFEHQCNQCEYLNFCADRF